MGRGFWLNRLGNSAKLWAWKRAGKGKSKGQKIGVLAFEVGSLMWKLVQLWHSLSDREIIRLRDEIIAMEGVRRLVSDDDNFLLSLAYAEKLDSLSEVAEAVGRLGRKCADPAFLGFLHVYHDLLCNANDVGPLVSSEKAMASKVRKMEKYIALTSNLFQQSGVLSDLEETLRRLQVAEHREGISCVQQRVAWLREETRYLRHTSLWNQTYDSVVRLLAQVAFTILVRIRSVFADMISVDASFDRIPPPTGAIINSDTEDREIGFLSGPLQRCTAEGNSGGILSPVLNCVSSPKAWNEKDRRKLSIQTGNPSSARVSNEFPVWRITGSGTRVFDHFSPSPRSVDSSSRSHFFSVFRQSFSDASAAQSVFTSGKITLDADPVSFYASKCKFLKASSSTLGGSALALHYANVVVIIEKFLQFPHLIGSDARDDLYQMLPASIRAALRNRLRCCARKMASVRYNAGLAAQWKEASASILQWLSPLAHNMIRWHSERNFEQQQMLPRTNVLLLQTLYFADQAKTEMAITELLLGLNYVCRYEQEIRGAALMQCQDSHGSDEYLGCPL